MIICKNCGVFNEDNSKFCTECGKPIDPPEAVTAEVSEGAAETSVNLPEPEFPSEAPKPSGQLKPEPATPPPSPYPQPVAPPQPAPSPAPAPEPPRPPAPPADARPPKGSKWAPTPFAGYLLCTLVYMIPVLGFLISLLVSIFSKRKVSTKNLALTFTIINGLCLVGCLVLYIIFRDQFGTVFDNVRKTFNI